MGVWFEEAQSVFDDSHRHLFGDPEHSDEEERFLLLGISSAGRTLVLVHYYQNSDSLVLISARKASKKELRFYEEGI